MHRMGHLLFFFLLRAGCFFFVLLVKAVQTLLALGKCCGVFLVFIILGSHLTWSGR